MPPSQSTLDDFERAVSRPPDEVYSLCLYVTGATRHSVLAVTNLVRICEQYLQGRYELEVIDLYQQPELAAREQLIVAPTLIKKFPPPMRRLIGSLANSEDVLRRLGVVVA
jgi:circadian clock protein KaiB